ncbi:putative serine esterase-domain-containing protein [Suillus fuscotomentosus]|uniref:Serine esterase-domain-containing protein n=1 Tax=Suillus fuscotomentosus TaxID=1912939 RepID=A0AAD4EKM6_9AGAM|nr:putative serine esterase-domain-containing protein [Suillus fuscotomentosus]KAG1907847.1 putative serine esterase-domain-containing protein [Suillus fuscotomentosus]
MSDVHLLVLIHGMWGNPSHLAHVNKIIREVKGEVEDGDVKLEVLVAETNKDESTYDGIDWGGERVAEEIRQKTADLEKEGRKVTRFSVTGYSLGGLVARYVIGVLHQSKFFETVQPVNFNTLATPHIGIPRFPSTFSSISAFLGPKLLSRSGEQFFCVDKWSPRGRPLVEVLADPDRIFYQALILFPNIRIYANAINDLTVPYVTSGISAEDPFGDYEKNGIKIDFHEEYKHVIKSYSAVPLSSATTKEPQRWYESIRNMRVPLPPRFQAEFPLNLAVYALLPILFPTFICLALIRLSFQSHQSRGRLRNLEAQSTRERLVHIIGKLESELESAAVDLYDDPAGTPIATSRISGTDPADKASSTKPTKGQQKKSQSKPPPYQPLLTPGQLQCIENLNNIPQLKKERTFFEGVRNSHAVIVCRDPKMFKHHLEGEGVLRHWADHFEL